MAMNPNGIAAVAREKIEAAWRRLRDGEAAEQALHRALELDAEEVGRRADEKAKANRGAAGTADAPRP